MPQRAFGIVALLFACSLTTSGCDGDLIDIDAVVRGASLDRARESSVDEFFSRRMTNRPRKAAVGSWQILHENDRSVYYAYPRFTSLLGSRRAADALYRTGRSELVRRFPAYRNIAGNDVRLAVFGAIGAHRTALRPRDESLFLGWEWSARLATDGIHVDAVAGVTRAGVPSRVRYLVRLNATTLKVLAISERPLDQKTPESSDDLI
ncbi:MAG TPA: hypothetical protein PLE73_13300 [Spirochaetota bacterium]|nr:hypothetical protein [Spirochaetota bacterium]HOS41411.1 hypothetical protein [Spirochaetota bacterium]HPI24170.1 hypothetical protein [Spirochaetota bacterium]HPU89734.1 hypothetical protein [Spirochaetota bacterium]